MSRSVGETWIAVAVVGDQNMTRISGIGRLSDETLGHFSAFVAERPERVYYVVAVDRRTGKKKPADPLYVWHVGDGFEHAQGWWVEYDE